LLEQSAVFPAILFVIFSPKVPGVPIARTREMQCVGKTFAFGPGASSAVLMRSRGSEWTILEMVKSIFPKGCNRT